MSGGRYLFGPFGDKPTVTLVATGPDGWVGYPDWAMDGPEPVRADAPKGIGISFITADGAYSDPCHWDWNDTGQADVGDVKVGPGVDDLMAALREDTYYTSPPALTAAVATGSPGRAAVPLHGCPGRSRLTGRGSPPPKDRGTVGSPTSSCSRSTAGSCATSPPRRASGRASPTGGASP
jgi:hypothetical protein